MAVEIPAYRRRWRTPREWVTARKAMRRSQLAEPNTCGACGHYLTGGIRHWHYTLRWLSAWREPGVQRGRPALDIVFQGSPDLPDCTLVEVERGGWSVRVGEWIPRADGMTVLRLRRGDLPR